MPCLHRSREWRRGKVWSSLEAGFRRSHRCANRSSSGDPCSALKAGRYACHHYRPGGARGGPWADPTWGVYGCDRTFCSDQRTDLALPIFSGITGVRRTLPILLSATSATGRQSPDRGRRRHRVGRRTERVGWEASTSASREGRGGISGKSELTISHERRAGSVERLRSPSRIWESVGSPLLLLGKTLERNRSKQRDLDRDVRKERVLDT